MPLCQEFSTFNDLTSPYVSLTVTQTLPPESFQGLMKPVSQQAHRIGNCYLELSLTWHRKSVLPFDSLATFWWLASVSVLCTGMEVTWREGCAFFMFVPLNVQHNAWHIVGAVNFTALMWCLKSRGWTLKCNCCPDTFNKNNTIKRLTFVQYLLVQVIHWAVCTCHLI